MVAVVGSRRRGGGGRRTSSVTASISAPAENFRPALRLAVDAEGTRVSSGRLRSHQDAAPEGAELAPTEPNQLASERLNRHLSPFDKVTRNTTRPPGEIPELQKVTLEDARRFHDPFYGAQNPACSPWSVQSMPLNSEDRRVAAWQVEHRENVQPLVVPFKKVAPINEKIETPDKANAEFLAGERFQLSQNDPDYPAMVLSSYMFGEPITSRISDRIRNREGLSYGANARITVPAEGDAAMLSGTVSLNPGVGPKVEASFMDELKKVYDSGFTAAEVDAAKKAYADARMIGRSTDAALLNLMVSHAQLNRPLKWDADLEAKIQALSVADINAAFRRHIDPNGVSIVKAGDFKAAGVYK